jgi:hypothetical protein
MREDNAAELVGSVAQESVGKLGTNAVPPLRLEEALATDKGDMLSANAWHDIADAAALILACNNRCSSLWTTLRQSRAAPAHPRLSLPADV